ncbi:MAG: Thioredoxin [Myxococcaceae bacterium]|nr:Thioredoxin [Myxococcaceae bacterium]
MQKLPVILAVVLAACAHAPPAPTVQEALSALPLDAVGEWRPARSHGRVTVVTFIATWCFPCLVDLPVLTKLQKDHPSDLVVVLIGMDLEGRKVLEPFAEMNELRLPLIVADDQVRAGETPFGPIKQLPTRFIFRRDGTLSFAYAGVAEPKALIEAVERELK